MTTGIPPARPSSPFRDEQAAQIERLMSENEGLTEDNARLTQLVAWYKAYRPGRLRTFWGKWEVQLGRAIWTAVLTGIFGGLITFAAFFIPAKVYWDDMRTQALSNCVEVRGETECFAEDRLLYEQQCCDVDDLFEKRAQLDACLQDHSMAVCLRFVE